MKWIKKEWTQCISFYKNEIHKPTLITGIVFFAIGIFIWIVLAMNEDVLMHAYNWLMSIFEEKGMDMESISALDLFKNNVTACLYGVITGFIPFFYMDAFSLVINAASIGIIGAIYSYQHLSMLLLAAGLIPHGIFELPAIFISLAMGFKTCHLMTLRITGKIKNLDMKAHSINLVRIFVWIVLPLLIIAAIVEAHITPIIMNLFM